MSATSVLTVGTALAEGTRRLAAAGCSEPRLDAETLLAETLGVRRSHLYAHPERTLTPEEAAAWEERLSRRACREPVAYIRGRKEFYGLEFVVDERVLVPRPETELIVDRVRALAAEREICTLWDVGTGSGALALTLARYLPGTRVVASDVSRDALAVAALNRSRLGLEERVEFVQGDLLEGARGPVDVIVANLPYLRAEEYRGAMPEVSRYEPRVALDAGPTGLEVIACLLDQARALVPQPEAILLETGAGQGADVLNLARGAFPGRPLSLHRDLAGLDRVVEIRRDCARFGAVSVAGAGESTHILPAEDAACIDLAAAALRRGEVVAFPTDTVYGVGAAAFHPQAVRTLYEVKGRPEGKAIPLLLAGAGSLEQVVAAVPPAARRLMAAFWPGPLTLVLAARPEVPAVVRAGGPTVAVRVPDDPVARALIEAVGAPLATTSANRSGAAEALTAVEVVAQLGSGVHWVVDGGRSPGGTPSTVVDLSVEPAAIRRLGAVSAERLQGVLNPE